jgi:putative CocE/NonD family hydrolase
MRDGIRLHTFIYLPDPKVWPPPYPAIIQRTPYQIGKPGVLPGPDQPTNSVLRGWKAGVERGYAVVFQSTRGRFASEGLFRLYYDEATDGYDAVEWVARQDWCDGKVGIAGSSAAGIVAYAAAAEKPPHLAAVFSQGASSNFFNDVFYEGQSFELEFRLLGTVTPDDLSPSHLAALQLSGKELQETIELNRVIAKDLNSHALDSSASKWWMYLPLLDYPAVNRLLPFQNELLSHPSQDSFRDHLDFRSKIQIPTLHVTTWYDFAVQSNIETFRVVQEKAGNQKLFVGPGDHFAVYTPNFLPDDPFFPWFDYWLKGIDTKIMDRPPVYYYHAGTEKWRYGDEWPPVGVAYEHYFLHSDGTLHMSAPTAKEPSITYLYDPKNPVQTLGGRNLSLPRGPRDQRPVEPPNRKDVLVYRGDVLPQDIEIAGPVKIVLYASSSCKDTDFHGKLIEVNPDGKTMLILDGVIRAMYRHSPKNPMPLEPDEVYKFSLMLGDINHVFKAGSRIQVDVSSSNFPRRVRNTNSGNSLLAADTDKEMIVARNTIHHGSLYPSHLILPLLPPQKPTIFEGTASIAEGETTYKGPADLYVLSKAVYLNFKDRWMKWALTGARQTGAIRRFEGEGKTGRFTVVVTDNGTDAIDVSGRGQGIYFTGQVKNIK